MKKLLLMLYVLIIASTGSTNATHWQGHELKPDSSHGYESCQMHSGISHTVSTTDCSNQTHDTISNTIANTILKEMQDNTLLIYNAIYSNNINYIEQLYNEKIFPIILDAITGKGTFNSDIFSGILANNWEILQTYANILYQTFSNSAHSSDVHNNPVVSQTKKLKRTIDFANHSQQLRMMLADAFSFHHQLQTKNPFMRWTIKKNWHYLCGILDDQGIAMLMQLFDIAKCQDWYLSNHAINLKTMWNWGATEQLVIQSPALPLVFIQIFHQHMQNILLSGVETFNYLCSIVRMIEATSHYSDSVKENMINFFDILRENQYRNLPYLNIHPEITKSIVVFLFNVEKYSVGKSVLSTLFNIIERNLEQQDHTEANNNIYHLAQVICTTKNLLGLPECGKKNVLQMFQFCSARSKDMNIYLNLIASIDISTLALLFSNDQIAMIAMHMIKNQMDATYYNATVIASDVFLLASTIDRVERLYNPFCSKQHIYSMLKACSTNGCIILCLKKILHMTDYEIVNCSFDDQICMQTFRNIGLPI